MIGELDEKLGNGLASFEGACAKFGSGTAAGSLSTYHEAQRISTQSGFILIVVALAASLNSPHGQQRAEDLTFLFTACESIPRALRTLVEAELAKGKKRSSPSQAVVLASPHKTRPRLT